MANVSHFSIQVQYLCSVSRQKLKCLCRSLCFLSTCFYRFLLLRLNTFFVQVFYFISLSSIGFWVLKSLKPRTITSSGPDAFNPRSLDLFFTSVSATTVSSMSTVEMEVFSNSQLIVLTILMFLGGEVFLSMVGLHLKQCKLRKLLKTEDKVASVNSDLSVHQVELGQVFEKTQGQPDHEYLRYLSVRLLGFLVLGYLLLVHVLGIALVSIYMTVISSAKNVLERKGLKMLTFSTFTVVSTFSNCGFLPTNENMMVFSKNSGLLWLLIPQILIGDTLFPSCLRFCLWVFGKFIKRDDEVVLHMLENSPEIGYLHLLPGLHSKLLVVTVFGFIGVQTVMFCIMEWTSESLGGLNLYQKIVGALFQCVNSRHTGESIVDLSKVAPAMLVLFVVMMYLPPYTSFLPVKDENEEISHFKENPRKLKIRNKIVESLIFSQLSYLGIFIILVCITEREKMKKDPLNFNVLNIIVEVISAYGNVGFTTGYSCERQLNPEAGCTDKWYGFSGKWSDEGKIILIVVMIFGRLKKFNMNGGKGWKLL